jgi:hypothetical protein
MTIRRAPREVRDLPERAIALEQWPPSARELSRMQGVIPRTVSVGLAHQL